jgi:hypothetical protein
MAFSMFGIAEASNGAITMTRGSGLVKVASCWIGVGVP